MPKYVFQESRIWEAGNPVDPCGKVFKTKKSSLSRVSFPTERTGRVWVLVSVDGKKV